MSKRPPRKSSKRRTRKEKLFGLPEAEGMLLRQLSELASVSLESPELLVEPDPDPLADLDPQVAEAILRSLNEVKGRLYAAFGKEAPPPMTLSQYEAARAVEKAPWRLICERFRLPVDPMGTWPKPRLLRIFCRVAKNQKLDPQFEKALYHVLIEDRLRSSPKYTKTEFVGGLANALVARGKLKAPAYRKVAKLVYGRVDKYTVDAVKSNLKEYKKLLKSQEPLTP